MTSLPLHGRPGRGALLAAVALLCGLGAAPASAAPGHQDRGRPVTVQLKWWHQFQFAGFYAARDQGYFADEGLAVTLLEGGPNRPPLPELAAHNAEFVVGDSDALLARAAGLRIVAVAAIFQHSPYVLLSLRQRGIERPAEMLGRRVMVDGHQGAAQLRAMLLREGLDPAAVTFVRHSWRLEDLVDGQVDAMSAYVSVEPLQLRARGFQPAVLDAADYGIDFYGDTVYALEDLVTRDPELVTAFVRALRRGWLYAFDHVDEVATGILAMPGAQERGLTLELLRDEAARMRGLVLPHLVEIGHMNPSRWERIAATYAELGLMPAQVDLSGFVFDPQVAARRRARLLLVGLGAVLLVALLGAAASLRLSRLVRHRTRDAHREAAQREQIEASLRLRELELLRSQKLQTLGQLVGGLAHDINNVLTVVMMNTQLVHESADPDVRDSAAEILLAARRGADMVRRLLAFGRHTSGKREQAGFNGVVRGVTSMVGRLLGEQIRLVQELSGEEPVVEVDVGLLEQVLVNLAVNARDAMPGGGTLIFRTGFSSEARPGLPGPGRRHALLEVEDTGTGMSPEVQARLFEPFFTTKSVGKGTGLGMSIVLGIVEQHGGWITVRTAPGAGTTFGIHLPLSSAPPAAHAAPPPPATLPQARDGECVLVVEDDLGVRRALAAALERQGFTVRAATDATEAVLMLTQSPAPSLLVTDLVLPGGTDGCELVDQARARLPELPVLIVTGRAGDPAVMDAVRARGLTVVTKPYSVETILKEIRAALDAASPADGPSGWG